MDFSVFVGKGKNKSLMLNKDLINEYTFKCIFTMNVVYCLKLVDVYVILAIVNIKPFSI